MTATPRPHRSRSQVETPGGTLLLMPAVGDAGVGVKLVTVTGANPAAGLPLIHAVYTLFDPVSQAPTLLVDGAALTALRTAAVSGLATRHLARADAARLVIFGAGRAGRCPPRGDGGRPADHAALGRDEDAGPSR